MNAVILHQYRQIISQIPLQFENPKMNQIIECYEQTVQQLTQTLNDNRTYQHRFQSYEVFEEIKREEDEIQQLLEEVKARAIVLRQLRQKQTTFITQHPHYPTIRMQELYPSGQQPSETQHWLSCQINHTIKITLSVHSLHHFLQEWGNLENQLLFQSFQLHLHHIDKRDSSRLMRYHPSKNMYHVSHMVDNKLIRSDRSMTLSVQHVLRTANIELYRQLLNRQPITVVAESSYGAVLGIAEIDICDKAAGGQFKNMPICLKFSRKCQQDNSFIQQSPIFYALCELSLSISAVPPQLEQLTRNCQSQFKQKEGSRSPSPSRIISTGSKQREKSPKVKRQLVSKMVCPGAAIQLTIYEGWQHKHQVQDVNLSVSKELIYKSLVNIKERRIELVKAGDNFYFKLFAVKQQGRKAGSIVFSFNSKEYQLHVVPHTLFQTMPLALYQQSSKLQRKDTQLFFENGLVDLGQGNVVYARENNRIQKNLAKLQIQCRLLGTLFVRSILSQCEVHCNPPFKILQAVKKQDGFMLTYRCQLDFTQPKERVLVVYLNSKMNNINEMHVYSCLVLPRKVTQQTLYREIYVRQGEEFARLSLKMIASQSYIYEIQASEADKVRVVNGCNFSYTNGGNQYLVLQIVSKDLPLLSDLILRDNKKRASFMRLCIKVQF